MTRYAVTWLGEPSGNRKLCWVLDVAQPETHSTEKS